VQVPRAERHQFRATLDAVGYRYWEETDNIAYRLYLGRESGVE
jgi:threonine dehydratase